MTLKKTLRILILTMIVMAVPATLFADGMSMIDPSLIGTWKWTTASTPAGSLDPSGDAEYVITFMEDGGVHMKLEINVVNGTYEADGKTLTVIPPMMMTLAAWQPNSPAPALLQLLEKARDYTVSDNDLSIKATGALGTAEFTRQ